MDQAALLREMMSKLQQEKTNAVAVLSTSDASNSELYIEKMVGYLAERTKKKHALMGIQKSEKSTIEQCVYGEGENGEMKEVVSPYLMNVNGELTFVSKIRQSETLMNRFTKIIKEVEEKTDTLVYYAGTGMDITAINLTLAGEKVLIFMKPTVKSYTEVVNMIKIFSKLKANESVGIVIDTFDQRVFEEQIKKIQDYGWSEFNYKIEPIGFFDTKYLTLLEEEKVFGEFDFRYLNEKKEKGNFSDSISSIMR